MNHFPFHIGDYAEATGHLSFVEDSAYLRCIRKYYSTEKPLPADIKSVQRLVGARSKEELNAVETVLNEFFVLEDDGWHNPRCDSELAIYFEKSDKAKASANARWKSSSSNANAMRTHNERNAPIGANAIRTHMPTQCEGNANQEPITKNQEPINKTHTTENLTPGNVCVLLKSFGIASVNPSHPKLMRLLEMGATSQDFESAAITARDKEKGFAYVLGVVEGQKADAKKMNSGTSRQKFDPVAFVNQGREAAHAVIDIN